MRPGCQRLARLADNPHLKVLDAVDKPRPRVPSYLLVINMIQWTIFASFLSGAAYATWLSRM